MRWSFMLYEIECEHIDKNKQKKMDTTGRMRDVAWHHFQLCQTCVQRHTHSGHIFEVARHNFKTTLENALSVRAVSKKNKWWTNRACSRAKIGPGPRETRPEPCSAARLVPFISFFFFAYLFYIFVFGVLQTSVVAICMQNTHVWLPAWFRDVLTTFKHGDLTTS